MKNIKLKIMGIISILLIIISTQSFAIENINPVDEELGVVRILQIAEDSGEEKNDDPDASRTFQMPKNNGNGGTTDAINDAEKLVTATEETVEVVSESELKDFSNSILNVLLPVGVIIAVIIGLILGIKLMLGPVSERADAKKLLIPYVAGCVIVFGAFGIWKLAITIMQGV